MDNSKKIIKYIAMIFGLVLALGIILSIISAAYSLLSGFNFINTSNSISDNVLENAKESESILSDTQNLYIESSYGKVIIKNGDSFKVLSSESNNNIKIENDDENKTTVIKNKPKMKFFWNQNTDITIIVPENFNFKNFEVKTGAGELEIEKINCENLKIETGAGETVIKEMTAKNQSDIKCGAGEVVIEQSFLNNAKIETGIGSTKFNGSLTGDCKIDCGIGEIKLELENYENDFNYNINKGIGEIKINNRTYSNSKLDNSATNNLVIKGGIGQITILTK
ncbi:MAG: DUF4097 family beta strand repeat-containing protein [Clostridia bacterium]